MAPPPCLLDPCGLASLAVPNREPFESMDGGGITRLLAGKQMGTEHAPFCRGPGSWTRSHVEATTSFGGCALARSLARRQDRIRRQRVGVLLGGEAHRGRQERDGRRRLLRQPRHKTVLLFTGRQTETEPIRAGRRCTPDAGSPWTPAARRISFTREEQGRQRKLPMGVAIGRNGIVRIFTHKGGQFANC